MAAFFDRMEMGDEDAAKGNTKAAGNSWSIAKVLFGEKYNMLLEFEKLLHIDNATFGPFPKVALPLHEKSAKDGALCKVNKKRTRILSDSGIFWSR